MARKPERYWLSALCLAAASLASASLVAQEIEEVVVTATRRAESIQDVPVSVVAVSGAMIEKVGITDVADLTTYVPNFEFASNTIQTNLYIRGIGSGPTHAIEQSVGRFVDDVYTGRADMNINGFMDVGSVEVLRGPQGTLFGKNTVAGAIIINTNKPTDEFEAGVSATYGEYSTVNNYKEIEAFFSGPLSETLRGRMAVRYFDDGGYTENVLPGPDGVERRMLGARLILDWDASDQTLVRLKGDFHNLVADGQPLGDETIASTNPRYLDFVDASVLGPNWKMGVDCEVERIRDIGGGETVNIGTFCPFKDQDTYILSLTVDHELPGIGTFKSITAQQHYGWDEQFMSVDNGVSGGAFRAVRAEEYDAFTQEFRLTSEENDRYDYIVGLYYEDSTVDRFQRSTFDIASFLGGGPPFDGNTRNEPWEQDTETVAAFGQFRYHFNDEVSMIVGARWTEDKKDFTFNRFWNEIDTFIPLDPAACPACSTLTVDQSRSESDFTPSVQLTWSLNDDVSIFANYLEGYKAGGFSDRLGSADSQPSYGAESNTTLELGMKGSFIDGALNLYLTLFDMDIEDLQVASILPNTAGDFVVTNAAAATSSGLELEGDWQITDSFLLGGNISYTDAEYDRFSGECPGAPASQLPFVPPVQADGTCDFSGLPLPYAPEIKSTVYGDWYVENAVGDWDFTSRLTWAYSDDYFTNPTFALGEFQDSYSRVDATVRLVSPSDRYSWTLTGRNLTEEAIADWSILVAGTSYALLKPPREIALTFAANFD